MRAARFATRSAVLGHVFQLHLSIITRPAAVTATPAAAPWSNVGAGFAAGHLLRLRRHPRMLGPILSPSPTPRSPRTRPRAATSTPAPATVFGLVGAGVEAVIMNYLGGTANVSVSNLDLNQAIGGDHNKASGTGALFVGLGAGGAIYDGLGNYNSSGYGPLGASVVTVSGCTIDLNQAQGGGGGNGEGGGIYVGSGSSATIDQTLITLNLALGGLSGWGSSGGQGVGGGLFIATGGSATLKKSLVIGNWASTSNNDLYGTVTYS